MNGGEHDDGYRGYDRRDGCAGGVREVRTSSRSTTCSNILKFNILPYVAHRIASLFIEQHEI
jgi:hypothetical protein